MSPTPCILFVSRTKLRVAILHGDSITWHELPGADTLAVPTAEASAVPLALSIAEILSSHQPVSLSLALDSALCLCAPLSMQHLPRRGRRRLLVYQLEEKLPLAAEDFVADFVLGPQQTLGICVRTSDIQPLIEALEQKDLFVDLIAPTAILAAESQMSIDESGPDVLMWQTEQGIELLQVRQGRPELWFALPADAESLLEHLSALKPADRALKVAVHAQDPKLLAILSTAAPGQVTQMATAIDEAAITAVGQHAKNSRQPLINLRRDDLAPSSVLRAVQRPFVAALAAGAILLLSLVVTFFGRAYHDRSLAESYRVRQEAIFTEFMPGQALPLDIRSRLESEATKLQALCGKSSSVQRRPSALLTLRDLLLKLPPSIRFRMDLLNISPDRLSLEGMVRSHGDAEALVTSLKTLQRYTLGPPHTEQAGERGVVFTLSGGPRKGGSAP